VVETLGQAVGLTPEELKIIFDMKQAGRSLEQISQEIQVALEVLKQFLDHQDTDATYILEGKPIKFDRRSILKELERTHPQFICSYNFGMGQLYRTNLLTGKLYRYQVPNYEVKQYCRWSELPGGCLLVTGGHPPSKEVVKIDTLREWAVCLQPPMPTAKCDHAVVYHSQYLYLLGGSDGRDLRECERYVCAESRWEVLPTLPVACSAMSAVVLPNSLYTLGGYANQRDLDTVQKLS
jgi:hypothetical protein